MSLAELLSRFATPLDRLSIPYMATGAVAAIVYGEPRLTADLDLVLKLNPTNAADFLESFPSNEFYRPPLETVIAESERSEHGHFNLLHLESGLRADLYLAGDDPLNEWGLTHRRQARVGDREVWLAPAEYVIVRKLEYFKAGGASRHLDDIRGMLRVSPNLAREPILLTLVKERGLEREWERALSSR